MLAGSRNVEVLNFHGEFIFFIRSDNMVEHNAIEKLLIVSKICLPWLGLHASIELLAQKIRDRLTIFTSLFDGCAEDPNCLYGF